LCWTSATALGEGDVREAPFWVYFDNVTTVLKNLGCICPPRPLPEPGLYASPPIGREICHHRVTWWFACAAWRNFQRQMPKAWLSTTLS
jgi:hypothetical protein